MDCEVWLGTPAVHMEGCLGVYHSLYSNCSESFTCFISSFHFSSHNNPTRPDHPHCKQGKTRPERNRVPHPSSHRQETQKSDTLPGPGSEPYLFTPTGGGGACHSHPAGCCTRGSSPPPAPTSNPDLGYNDVGIRGRLPQIAASWKPSSHPRGVSPAGLDLPHLPALLLTPACTAASIQDGQQQKSQPSGLPLVPSWPGNGGLSRAYCPSCLQCNLPFKMVTIS